MSARFRPIRGPAGLIGLTAVALAASIALFPSAVRAQEPTEDDEPLFDELVGHFKKESLSIGALFQTVADFQPERSFRGRNGFRIANMRLSVSGELDAGFGYFFQTNFANEPAVLDAKMYFRVLPFLTLDAGLFKAPFSRELLTPAGEIDFVNRAQVVRALAPARQIGAQARGELAEGTLAYAVGVFNGNAFDENGNDSNDFLLVARIATHPPALRGPGAGDDLEIALNFGYSEDRNADLGSRFIRGFAGERLLAGADFRLTRGRLLLAGELSAASLDADAGPRQTPLGFHATAGWMVTSNSQALFRWDSLSPDGLGRESDAFIVGYNVWPTGPTQLRVNYVIPTTEQFENQQLLVSGQVSF